MEFVFFLVFLIQGPRKKTSRPFVISHNIAERPQSTDLGTFELDSRPSTTDDDNLALDDDLVRFFIIIYF